jgi:glycosyltransferase involved in cell wall biosynthesis
MLDVSKIRVANIIINLAMGGIERLSIQLCAHLNRDKFDPTLICIEGGGPLENEAAEYGVEVVKLGKSIKNIPGTVRALSRVLRELEVDVVHGNPGMLARLAAPKGAAKVSTYHNMLIGRGYLSLIPDRYLARRTDALVGISKAVAANAEKVLRLDGGSFHVIYNGVDIERIQALALESVNQDIVKKGPVVCFLGRLAPEKGVGFLIEAFKEVLNEIPDAVLWIIGDGPERRVLEERVRDGNIQAVFFGQQVNPYPLLAVSDVFCLPSFKGAFELALVEAMALGLPVIATKGGGVPEVTGNAALLVETGDTSGLSKALVKVLTDNGEAGSLSEKSIIRSDSLSISHTADDYATVYKEAVEAKRSS